MPCRYGTIANASSVPPRNASNASNAINSIVPEGSEAYLSPPRVPQDGTHVSGPVSPYDLNDADFDPGERRLLELQLLHHFIVVVSKTFPAYESPNLEDIWTTSAISFSFEHSFLLNAIFAISALHAAVEGLSDTRSPPPTRIPDYSKAHRIYLNQAVQEQRQALSALNTTNADAVGLTSILLSTVSAKLIPECRPSIYTPPVQWLSMANAIATVVQATAPLLREDSLMRILPRLKFPDFTDRAAIYNPEFLISFQPILDFDAASEDKDEERQEVYKKALTYIGGIERAIMKGDPTSQVCRRIMSFGPMMPRNFPFLLDQRRPRALLIVAHLMSMAKHVEQYWWFRGAAEREVYGIQSILPQEWQWAMNWPLEMLRTLTQAQMAVEMGSNGIIAS